jgi:hypothetical protein
VTPGQGLLKVSSSLPRGEWSILHAWRCCSTLLSRVGAHRPQRQDCSFLYFEATEAEDQSD